MSCYQIIIKREISKIKNYLSPSPSLYRYGLHRLYFYFKVGVDTVFWLATELPALEEDAFGLHGDDFDDEMTSRSEGMRFDLFDHVGWLITGGIIHEIVVAFSFYL